MAGMEGPNGEALGPDGQPVLGPDGTPIVANDPALAIGQQADIPYPTVDWTVKTPEEMGMDSNLIAQAFDYAFQPIKSTQGVVVVRGGAIVAEHYVPDMFGVPRDQNSYAASWSMAKSFASALIGIAIDEGKIPSVDVPLSTIFPEWAGDFKGNISLRSVLQMQSGLNFIEDYNDITTPAHVIQLADGPDTWPVTASLLPHPAGTDGRWYYSSGDTQLLSFVIERTTGMNASDYARQKIFDPIGMRSAQWWTDAMGHTYTYCCLDATTRDFAKFGLLFLRNGNWDGQQIVSESWVRESTTNAASHFSGYAYQWWLGTGEGGLPIDMYSAQGLDSQRIYVIPSLDLVIAKNTLMSPERPLDTRADTGWLNEYAPRGLRWPNAPGIGTVAPDIWDDIAFLAPIINSIQGSQKITEVQECTRSSPFDPQMCMGALASYDTSKIDPTCACNECAAAMLDCDQNPGCAAISRCALSNGCLKNGSYIDCATPCAEEINKFGGVDGCSVQMAIPAGECVLQARAGVGCIL